MSRLTTLALGMAVAAATLAGCSDDSSSSDTVASTTAAPTTIGVADTVPVADTVVDGTDAAGAGTEFCAINTELDVAASAVLDEGGTPADLQAFFEVEFPAQLTRITEVAPPELLDDVAVLGAGFTELGTLFAANDWDIAAAFADPALTDVLDNEAYVAAGTAVDAYCGA